MKFFAAGISFKTAPVELREQLAVAPADRSGIIHLLKDTGGLTEVVLLWTCNRVEVYGVAPELNGNVEAMFRHLTTRSLTVGTHLYCHQGQAAMQHLFAVTAGLDSMVLGETEITGQVKAAYEAAQADGMTGRVTNQVFQKALQTAKEIRTRTRIGKGATSVGSVCVLHARKILGPDFNQRTIMVIGAGKMAETCVRHLAKHGARSIIVANRSLPRATLLASKFNGRAIHFEECLGAMKDVDIVVSSTGCPFTILHRPGVEEVMAARPDRPLFMIDIAVPRDIAPDVAQIPNVFLDDIDDLEETVCGNVGHRREDMVLCQSIIDGKLAALANQLNKRREGFHVACP